MVVIKLDNGKDISGGVTYVRGGKGYVERDAYMELQDLEAGEYLFFVEIDWQPASGEWTFSATSYGESDVAFKRDLSASYSREEILRKAYTAKALAGEFEGLKVTDMADKGAPNIRRYQSG